MVINRNGVEYNVEKAIKNWTVYNIWWISREEYQRVLDLLWVTEQELADALDDLDDANDRITQLEAQLDTYEDFYDFAHSLFSPVVPTNTVESYSSYLGTPSMNRDRINMRVWSKRFFLCTWRPDYDTADYQYRQDSADWYICIVDEANSYNVVKGKLWRRAVWIWETAYRNKWNGFWESWGTRYLWQKWNQLIYHAYNYTAETHSSWDKNIYAYWLYTVNIDLDTMTWSSPNIESVYQETSYWELVPHPEMQYENLASHPDSTRTLVGNPNWTNFNPAYFWYKLWLLKTTWTYSQNSWTWTLWLQYTAVSS